MKTKNFLISFVVFVGLGIILFIISSKPAAYISFGFASMLLITYVTSHIMNSNKLKKLDERYFVLKKENLLMEYNKLTKDFDDGKLKQVTLTYLKFKKEYDDQTLKRFGLWLTKTYNADPSGFDDGIIILFVNVHELMMNELLKHIKEQILKEGIEVDFNYAYAIYETNETYEELKNRAIKKQLN